MGDLTMTDSPRRARSWVFASEVREGLRNKVEGRDNLQRIKDTGVYLINGFVFLCLRLFRLFMTPLIGASVRLSDGILRLIGLGKKSPASAGC
jgi:hypothetical protein